MASFLLTHFTAMAGRIRDAVFRPQQGAENASTSESKPLIDDWNPMRDANSSESSKQTMMLSDGRQLGFAIYGASSGNTVFYFHGLGDCRITGAWFDQAGKQLGARIVGVDRPGLGLSSPLLNRTASDFADDIRQLAAHLEAKTYGIIGVSGGGPYALACAHELPKEELKSVAIVCGMGPFSMSMRHFNWAPWLLYKLYIMFPSVLRWTHGKMLAQLKNTPTEKFVQETRTKMRSWQTWPWRLIMPSNKDLSLFQDEYFLTLTFTALQESNKQGVEGFMGDWRVLASRNLGFELEEVRKDLPLQLWYGKQDANVPWNIGEEIARRLGNNARLYLKDEAHLSLILNWRYQMLEKVLERM